MTRLTDRTFSAHRSDVVVFYGDDGRWHIQFLNADGSAATYPIPEMNRQPERKRLAQRCPVCRIRMTKREATELGRCADCVEEPAGEPPTPSAEPSERGPTFHNRSSGPDAS